MTPKWKTAKAYSDILYHKAAGMAKVTINRPEKRNAFRPETVSQLIEAFSDARDDPKVGVVLLTGSGSGHTDGASTPFVPEGTSRCGARRAMSGWTSVPRLNVLDLQKLIRSMPKVVIALVAGYAIGGGHVLHVVCDLTIAASNAVFGQVGPGMGSFDGGFGSSYLARIVGQKKAREIWFLCRKYTAAQALEMGLVNTVVPVASLEKEGVAWAGEILEKSPLAIRLLKSGFNAELDGQAGIQELAGNATLLYYMSEEAKEFHSAQRQKRKPDARRFPWLP